ncbi:hypothetical protein ADEAN_000998200 [Angomonas deanei]|uniref:Transmembrane protein n=1 Tax=Angomonas deanei TaxID=59799 RepID=A0A7G2CRJ3_9TRYP|nr:hypothetical protein ADEAN_000998200 [Angomonas deanei]
MKDENKNLADADDNHSHTSTHSSHASVISPRVVNLATVVVLCLFCISLSIRLSAEERPTPHVYDIRDVRSSGVPLRTSSEVIIPRLYTPLEAFFTAGSDTSICYVGTEEGNAAVLDGDSINNNNNNHGSESCSVCAQQHKDSTIDNILSSGQSFSQSLRDKEGDSFQCGGRKQ